MWSDPALRNAIAISLGAIAGALSRYYITLWCAQRLGTAFPYGTLIINLTGCLAMGFLATLFLVRAALPSEVRLLLTTGFLGAYTTFSTYGLEAMALFRGQEWGRWMLYWAGSAMLGMVAIYLGTAIAHLFAK